MNTSDAIFNLRAALLSRGYLITTQSWQGKEAPPEFKEFLHADIIFDMPDNVQEAREQTGATQPWADEHWAERVCGKPLNPPPSHVNWNTKTDEYLSGEKFSHSYPERLWSKDLHTGIRYDVADLNTAVELLKKEPDTRQCYIPFFFPEDLTAAVQGERVPCSFGWHFMLRNGKLHCSYHMRSCDAVRHFHNDIYFAIRLCMWLIEKADLPAIPGTLHFSATSFHCFSNDDYTLRKLLK